MSDNPTNRKNDNNNSAEMAEAILNTFVEMENNRNKGVSRLVGIFAHRKSKILA